MIGVVNFPSWDPPLQSTLECLAAAPATQFTPVPTFFRCFCRVVIFVSRSRFGSRLPLIKQPSNSGVHGKPQAARDQQMGREEGTPVSEDAQWV